MKIYFTISSILIFNFILSSITYAQHNPYTQQLINELYKSSAETHPPINIETIKLAIQNGADVNAYDPIYGGHVLHIASDNFNFLANGFPGEPHLSHYVETIKILLVHGADINRLSDEGITAISAIFANGNPISTEFNYVKKIFDLFIASGADINLRAKDGLSAFFKGIRAGNTEFIKYVLEQKNLNPNYLDYNINFGNLLHQIASGIKKDNALLLKLLEKVSPSQINILSRQKAGNIRFDSELLTPLYRAVILRNEMFVKYLLENTNTPLNTTNVLGWTPLTYAIKNKLTNIESLLRKAGAEESILKIELETAIKTNKCNEEIEQISMLQIKNLVDHECLDKINTVDDLIKILPKTLKSSYVLNYHSRALMKSNLEFPRVIAFNRTGHFIATFNGHKDLSGYNNFEVIEFNPNDKKFELFDIDFSKKTNRVSAPNPQKCLGCHGEDPRPLFDTWILWPGFYEGDEGKLVGEPLKHYRKFRLNQKNHSRYGQLLPQQLSPISLSTGIRFSSSKLFEFDLVLNDMLSAKAVRMITQDSDFNNYHSAFLAALSCENAKVSDFIPKRLNPNQDDYQKYYNELLKSHTEEAKARSELQKDILNGHGASRHKAVELYGEHMIGRGGHNSEISRLAQFQYLIKLIKGNTKITNTWFPGVNIFKEGQPSSTVQHHDFLEFHFWNYVMENNDELKITFEKEFNHAKEERLRFNNPLANYFFWRIYFIPTEINNKLTEKVCGKLFKIIN